MCAEYRKASLQKHRYQKFSIIHTLALGLRSLIARCRPSGERDPEQLSLLHFHKTLESPCRFTWRISPGLFLPLETINPFPSAAHSSCRILLKSVGRVKDCLQGFRILIS